MTKEEALKDFLKSLKLSLKNASIYPENHPAFQKSIREVKDKIDKLLTFSSPLRIGFTPHSLAIEGEYFEKEGIYKEVAKSFHIRKIKSIEIREGLTVEELAAFLTKVYLSSRDFLKEGGLTHILSEEKISHLAVEELDYFELLKGEAEEIKDIWPFLLQEAVEQEDAQKIIELADNFERVIGHIKIEDIFEKKEINENLDKFFTLLKDIEIDKLRQCSKDLLKAIIKNANVLKEVKVEGSKKLFKNLSAEEFASTLLEEILTDDSFNTLSFEIFSKLTRKRKQKKISDIFATQFKKQSYLSHSPKVRQKIKILLTGSISAVISEVYRQTLSALLQDLSTAGELTLDPNLIKKKFRYILLNLLGDEKRKKRIIFILENIRDECGSIAREKDLEYLKYLLEVLNKRSDLSSEKIVAEINQKIFDFALDSAALGAETPDFENFRAYLKKSFLGVKTHLNKIFKENKINPQILKSFFQLCPDSLPLFKKNLMMKSSDPEFFDRILESLKKVDSPLSLESIKYIYSFGSAPIRIKALKAMKLLSTHDEPLLFDILEKGDYSLKKEALSILIREESTKDKAIEKLFSIPSFFGTRNKILIENTKLIQELNLNEAKDNLVVLSQKKFFWNKKLRDEAVKALEKWNA